MDSDIEQFIEYYGKDQISDESQDTDFNDDGESMDESLVGGSSERADERDGETD